MGILRYRDYHSPSWAPAKADIWWPFFDLLIPSLNFSIKDRFIAENYCTDENSQFICLSEFKASDKNETEDSNMGITIIDLKNETMAKLLFVKNALLRLIKIENGNLIYSWTLLNQPSVNHEYEIDITKSIKMSPNKIVQENGSH